MYKTLEKRERSQGKVVRVRQREATQEMGNPVKTPVEGQWENTSFVNKEEKYPSSDEKYGAWVFPSDSAHWSHMFCAIMEGNNSFDLQVYTSISKSHWPAAQSLGE